MRVIICGGRGFRDRRLAFQSLDKIHDRIGITMVIEGGQRIFEGRRPVGGADYWGEQWAISCGIPVQTVPADWRRWGSAAGPIRNDEMLRVWKPDAVVAFEGGPGTADMVDRALRANKRVYRVGRDGVVTPTRLQ